MTYAQPDLKWTGSQSDAILDAAYPSTAATITVDDASRLPVLAAGDFFYAILVAGDRSTADRVKVTETAGNTLTVERLASTTTCYPVGSRIVYDGNSSEADNEKVVGTIRQATSPVTYDPASRTVALDLEALQKDLTGLVNKADAPLSYDETSGILTLDVGALETTLKIDLDSWVKDEARAAISNTDGTLSVTNGVINVNVTALKTALGIA